MDFQRVQYFAAFAVLFFGLTNGNANDEILVKLAAGSVRGTTMTSSGGHNFFAFLGIPYAEPPENDLRFKPPVPKQPWDETEEILDATHDGPVCPQVDFLTHSFIGQEDCLSVNVYTPQIPGEGKKEKFPVLVFIHGGGFMNGMGSSWMYGPQKLIDHGIVFVTINYRLGAFGFLSTGDESSPGNYGLLDQTEALRWVQSNIGAFGGDPDKITLSGHSAGSASALYHVISPLSKGLFHQAIPMSGSPTCLWAHTTDANYWTTKLANSLKCPTANSKELIDCLRKIPTKKLITAIKPLAKIVPLPFVPVTDNIFLSGIPRELLSKKKIANKVPILMGITEEEGGGLYAFVNTGLGKYSEDFLKFNIRSCLSRYRGDDPEIVEMIKQTYLNNLTPTDDVDAAKSLTQMYSDGMIDVCHYETVKLLVNAGLPIRVYSYDFAADYSILKLFGIKENLGVAHGDELPILFSMKPLAGLPVSERVEEFSERTITSLTNFVKFGVPTPDNEEEWPLTVDGDEVQLYHIDDRPSLSTLNPFLDPKFAFWLREIPRAIKRGAQKIKDEL